VHKHFTYKSSALFSSLWMHFWIVFVSMLPADPLTYNTRNNISISTWSPVSMSVQSSNKQKKRKHMEQVKLDIPKDTVLWDVMCSLEEAHLHYGGLWSSACCLLVTCLAYSLTLEMEAVCSSKMFVSSYHATVCIAMCTGTGYVL
jgi:hypothetical protein